MLNKKLLIKSICCVVQAVGANATEKDPAVLQQWVPQYIADQVKMVRVRGLRGGKGSAQQLPLTRELIAVDWHASRGQSHTGGPNSRLPQARASIRMPKHFGKLTLRQISQVAHGDQCSHSSQWNHPS